MSIASKTELQAVAVEAAPTAAAPAPGARSRSIKPLLGLIPFVMRYRARVVAALIALVVALLMYAGLARLGLPVLLFYGIMRGMDQSVPYAIVPQFIGALLGRYYFAKKFGEKWRLYIVVFFAGYSCGVGLVR